MKILFASFRHDPRAWGKEVGADYHFLQALQINGMDVRVVGPFTQSPILPERVLKRLYSFLSGGRYIKYDFSNTLRASYAVNKLAEDWRPDLIFSLYPSPLAFYEGSVPCVFRTDATFTSIYTQYPEFQVYGKKALSVNIWLERKAVEKCSMVVTHSEWTRQSLLKDYHLCPQKIAMFPNPAALPAEYSPRTIDFTTEKKLSGILRLLFIGRDPYRKGLDIALETVAELNRTGFSATLTVCGLRGTNSTYVTYVGNLSKITETERVHYLTLLRSAHFLLHPARFDPSPRVTSEAAAFGTPTITNDAGGLSTSVRHGESGLVLPGKSPPEVYVQAIRELISRPEEYYALCYTTRKHYDKELNSTIAGKRLTQILQEVVCEQKQN